METYNVIAATPYPEFNWAFTAVIVWVPFLFAVKAVIRVITRS